MAWTFFSILLIALTATSSSGQNSSYSLGANDSDSSWRRPMFIPQIPKECDNLTFCENVPNYPQEYVDALLAKLSDINSVFNLNKIGLDTQEMLGGGEELCKSETKIITPDAVKTKDGKWVFVVYGKLKEQTMKVVLCIDPNKPCSDIAAFPPDYTSACKQQFIEELTLVLDDDGKMAPMNIPLPACCSCTVYPTRE